jgi:uncharacterized RDD family membrane protein YckC
LLATDQATPLLAGFWRRFAAFLIDGLIVSVVVGALTLGLNEVGYLIGWLGGLAYYVILEGGRAGQTVGKIALGIRVSDPTTGGSIGYGRATIRYFGRILSALPLYLGYFWMLWDRRNQTWHDKLANDVVVSASRSVVPAPTASAGPLAAAAREAAAAPAAPTAPPPPSPPPANWYADPHGQARLRYWDGTQWTEHTSD